MSDLIPLETAERQGFAASTPAELRAYYLQVTGEKAPPAMKPDNILKALLAKRGIVNEFSGVKASAVSQPDVAIFPPYNLTPNGEWGGRCHRIKASKPPDATKSENAWIGSWNGSPDQVIFYNEVAVVPEPIYLRIRSQEQITPVAKRIFNQEDGSVDVTTELKVQDRHSISYLGVDPATADRAGSLTEWYQMQGPDWFRERSDRDHQRIAQYIEMRWQDADGNPLNATLLRNRLIEFFFGHADAKAA